MEIRHIEYIKLLLLSLNIASTALVKGDNLLFGEINEFFSNNNISMEDIRFYSVMGYDASLFTGFWLEQLTRDYEEIESLYKQVVLNTAELIEGLGINDNPIKIFALFVYLYRSGYLSNNKKFLYSSDMKDLPLLCGADVIRGTGVCRSISSMFTDVCNSLNLSASNLVVRANNRGLAKKEALSLVPLAIEEKSKVFAKIVGVFSSVLPIGNHLVTLIDSDKCPGVYDPTNDVFMQMKSPIKYSFINDSSATMSYNVLSSVLPNMFGQMRVEVNLSKLSRVAKKKTLSYEEYCSVYRETLDLIKKNIMVFEEFYHINLPFYQEVDKLMTEQHSMIKRMIPIFPKEKNK